MGLAGLGGALLPHLPGPHLARAVGRAPPAALSSSSSSRIAHNAMHAAAQAAAGPLGRRAQGRGPHPAARISWLGVQHVQSLCVGGRTARIPAPVCGHLHGWGIRFAACGAIVSCARDVTAYVERRRGGVRWRGHGSHSYGDVSNQGGGRNRDQQNCCAARKMELDVWHAEAARLDAVHDTNGSPAVPDLPGPACLPAYHAVSALS